MTKIALVSQLSSLKATALYKLITTVTEGGRSIAAEEYDALVIALYLAENSKLPTIK